MVKQLVPAPTDEIIARAEQKFGRVLRIEFPFKRGVVTALARPFDAEAYDRFFDAQMAAPDDATLNTLRDRILWPVDKDLDAVVDGLGMFPDLLVGALAKHAGGGEAACSFVPLDEDTTNATLAAAGLTREQADSLIAESRGMIELSLVLLRDGGALVLRAPSYSVLQALQRAATAKKAGFAAAIRTAAIQCTSWCSSGSAEALFRASPALAAMFTKEIFRLGGAEADAQFPVAAADLR